MTHIIKHVSNWLMKSKDDEMTDSWKKLKADWHKSVAAGKIPQLDIKVDENFDNSIFEIVETTQTPK